MVGIADGFRVGRDGCGVGFGYIMMNVSLSKLESREQITVTYYRVNSWD